MIPTRIFLDLDDTCNLFTLHALQHVGCGVDPAEGYGQYGAKFGWDIVKAANELHPDHYYQEQDFTVQEFWNCFDRETWRNVPPSDELPMLLRNCVALVGRKNICILSAPVDSPGCLEGKLDWIHKYLPKWLHQQFFIGSQKYLLARPGALLIDDAEHNIKAFKEHGGQTLLVPRPWNSLHDVNTIEHLTEAFRKLLERKRNRRSTKYRQKTALDFW
jgi:5'(3')-deoxyribonucleotidase